MTTFYGYIGGPYHDYTKIFPPGVSPFHTLYPGRQMESSYYGSQWYEIPHENQEAANLAFSNNKTDRFNYSYDLGEAAIDDGEENFEKLYFWGNPEETNAVNNENSIVTDLQSIAGDLKSTIGDMADRVSSEIDEMRDSGKSEENSKRREVPSGQKNPGDATGRFPIGQTNGKNKFPTSMGRNIIENYDNSHLPPSNETKYSFIIMILLGLLLVFLLLKNVLLKK